MDLNVFSFINLQSSIANGSVSVRFHPFHHRRILELWQRHLFDSLTDRLLRPISASGVRYFQFATHFAQSNVGDSILPGELDHWLAPDLVVQLKLVQEMMPKALPSFSVAETACLESGFWVYLLRTVLCRDSVTVVAPFD